MATEYTINYHTHNQYEAPVTEALFELLVAPCTDATQRITKLTYYNSLGQELYYHGNPFDFQVACLRSAKHFNEFKFTMRATVEKSQPWLIVDSLPFAEEQAILASRNFYIDHHLYLGFTHYTSILESYHTRLLNRPHKQPVIDYLTQLNQYVYELLEFDPVPTNVHTTASEVFYLGKGVCQDYTHLFLAIARLNRIPCRYVSGYLNQGGSLVGSAVMHAWAEAFIPGHGWFGFDPTNNLLVSIDHIKAAHGVDYSDCSPLRGILKTQGQNYTSYYVDVLTTQMQEQTQQ
ncbi:transglutaminase-like domain-containing protein [Adhaeribacter radiodurans]|uniref:Transglutaminase family protein n=1 Tax=Adhaeribacter radiodurans TaxID=2745197 RepID=A0A7L7L8T7_9BACT|nr:transglutaminase family protein [Adhaeribacter radiodurans]QMU29134.1 transglutaminase family protein [Adhaeribacter radiodurans]